MHTPVMIFDFDGTIADTHHFMVKICNRLAPQFGYKPIQPHEVEELRDKSAQDLIHHLSVPIIKIPSIVRKAKHLFHEGVADVKLIEGMHDALHELHRCGVTLGILSSNDRKNIEAFLDNHDIHIFDFIYSPRTIWGKHHSLRKVMHQHGFDPSGVFYIGDESRDVMAARRAKVSSVAVAWGCNSRGHLAEEQPDHLLDRPEDLLSLCEVG